MRATVSEVRFDGLVLRVEGRVHPTKEAWLPCEEWSTVASEWDWATLHLDANPNYELDVVSLSRVKDGRLVVSRKNINAKTISDSSTASILIRDMEVEDYVGRRLIRGKIGIATPAIISGHNHQSYIDWVDSKALTQELSDHAVLGKGDLIRGFVKGLDHADGSASLILEVSEYLDFRSKEIAKTVVSPTSRQEEDSEEQVSLHKKLQREVVAKISPVLLADDNECRVSIANVLRREGVDVDTLESSEQAQEFLDSFSTTSALPKPTRPYRLAILDPNLMENSTDLIGLRIAAKLRATSDCRVIVMTGAVKMVNMLGRWPELGIHGYIEKPFTMVQLIREIEDAVGLAKPLPLGDWIRTERRDSPSVKGVGNPVESHDTSEMSVTEVLLPLGRLKPGTVIHVFELHPRSYRARSLGSFAGASLRWESLRGKIAKSVIKDTAMAGPMIHDANIDQNQLRHLWTLEMMKYQSFCGMPVHVKGKRVALVVFHPDRNAFDNPFLGAVRIIAERVGRAIERQSLYETRRNEAELASFGMALAALAHELASDMTALNANLKDLGDIASDNEEDVTKRKEALDTLERIRGNVDVITRKTRILRRTHARTDRVSLVDCLKKAATACITVVGETIKHPERVLIREVEVPAGNWNVSASMASLIIVFFNLYLNAAQQIDLASVVRKYGLIWSSVSRFIDARGKAWARVRIHDTGPGIHRDDWEQVFDPGYSTKPNGSGLGLYICRYLLRDCFATIAVTSSVIWDGTTFTVNIPLAD